MNSRDERILKLLKHFRVLSRDQLAILTCREVANPTKTINRVMNRLARDCLVTVYPQPKAQHLYMPNPPMIKANIKHFLGLVEIFIRLNQPKIYEVEPAISENYQPDVYTRIPQPIIIEYQRSEVSNKIMQQKIDNFVRSYQWGQHDATTLWIVSNKVYKVKIPEGFQVLQTNMKIIG